MTRTRTRRRCKDCESEGVRANRPAPFVGPRCSTHNRAKKAADALTRRLAYVKAQYSLDAQRYLEMLGRHDGMCWLCQWRKARAVDHDHSCCPGKTSCGKCVRGLLCNICNGMLGRQRDKVEVFERTIRYLKENNVARQ